jgi:hypothetical protein
MIWLVRIPLIVLGLVVLDMLLVFTGPAFDLIFPAAFLTALVGGIYMMIKFSWEAQKKRRQSGRGEGPV